MARHVKQTRWKVGFNKDDAAVLRELAQREGELRKDPELGVATVVRELVMPPARVRLAELKSESLRSQADRRAEEDRRSGEERRAPALATDN